MSVPLTELANEFQSSYLPSRNLAPLTRGGYRQVVRHFVAWAEEHGIGAVQEIELRTLDRFLAHLDGRGLAGGTRRKYVYALKLFFAYLESRGHVGQSAAARLIPPATEQKEPRVLSPEEYGRLRELVRYHPRDAAIVDLLLNTGLRMGELATVTTQDLYLPKRLSPKDEEAGSLTIRQGKGRKDRTVSLNYLVCEALGAYLRVRPEVPYPQLFLTKHKQPMKPRAIFAMLARRFAALGIERAHPHTLRHTFGTELVRAGEDLRTLQEMLGHKNLATTSRYVSLARRQMDRSVQRVVLK